MIASPGLGELELLDNEAEEKLLQKHDIEYEKVWCAMTRRHNYLIGFDNYVQLVERIRETVLLV